MNCGTLMVYMGLSRPNDELLRVAVDLACRLQAGVIGIAARQPARVGVGDGFVFWDHSSGDHYRVCNEFKNAESEFRSALECRVRSLEWRSTAMCASIADYVAYEMRHADMLLIGIDADVLNASRRLKLSEFVTQFGRPVIIVPTAPRCGDVLRADDRVRGNMADGRTADEVALTLDLAPPTEMVQTDSWGN
ncbi:MAG: hypothetical protein ABI645_06900 [Pseudomonadota bacterium]